MLEKLQREEECVFMQTSGNPNLHTYMHIGGYWWEKSSKSCARGHTHLHTVRSQLSTPASQLIKPNPRDWTEEFK